MARLSGAPAPVPVREARRLRFVAGMPGLEEYRDWTLIPLEDCPLYWLQCEAEPALALPLADAPAVLPDYAFELSTADVHALDLRAAEEALVLVVLTVPADGGTITANLLAPVVVNVRTWTAKQVILDGTRYSLRHPLGGPIDRAARRAA
jgi:flagellar assembly factor FliW